MLNFQNLEMLNFQTLEMLNFQTSEMFPVFPAFPVFGEKENVGKSCYLIDKKYSSKLLEW